MACPRICLRFHNCLACALAIVALACSCSRSASTGLNEASQRPGGNPASLESPSELARHSPSFSQQSGLREGDDYLLTGPAGNISPQTPACNFAAAPNSIAYASYGFSLAGAAGSAALELQWTVPPAAGDLYIGLSNWDTDRWDWVQSDQAGQFSFDGLEEYVSDSDQLFLVVLLNDSPAASLDRLQLREDPDSMPTAVLEVSPFTGQQGVGGDLSLNASESSDADGPLDGYEWDLDADGNFGASLQEQGFAGQSQINFEYTPTHGGDQSFSVRVEDSNGNFATASGSVHSSGWGIVTLESDKPINKLSMANIGGRPALAYSIYSNAGGDVYYCLSADSLGDQPEAWTRVKITQDGRASWISLQEIDGRPAIASGLIDSGPTVEAELVYQRAADSDGDSEASWAGAGSTTLTLDQGAEVQAAYSLSMAAIGGQPAIAYVRQLAAGQNSYDTAFYKRSSSSDGAALQDWSTAVPVHVKADPVADQDTYGLWCDLEEINGRPALAYQRVSLSGDRHLYYNISSDSSGTDGSDWTGNSPVWINSESASASWTQADIGSLMDIGGCPAINYSSGYLSEFRFRKAANPGGALASDWSSGEDSILPSYGGRGMMQMLSVPSMLYVRYPSGDPHEVWMARKGPAGGPEGDWEFDIHEAGPVAGQAENTFGRELCSVAVDGSIRGACLTNDMRSILYLYWQE